MLHNIFWDTIYRSSLKNLGGLVYSDVVFGSRIYIFSQTAQEGLQNTSLVEREAAACTRSPQCCTGSFKNVFRLQIFSMDLEVYSSFIPCISAWHHVLQKHLTKPSPLEAVGNSLSAVTPTTVHVGLLTRDLSQRAQISCGFHSFILQTSNFRISYQELHLYNCLRSKKYKNVPY